MDTFMTVLYTIGGIVGVIVVAPILKKIVDFLKLALFVVMWYILTIVRFGTIVAYPLFIILLAIGIIKNGGIKVDENEEMRRRWMCVPPEETKNEEAKEVVKPFEDYPEIELSKPKVIEFQM